ncbi:HNH endonuclease [Alcaligenaceae bacterium A4P071]|nr:HNH endonuclease [Alcaligenaceae bacterium A4P071]
MDTTTTNLALMSPEQISEYVSRVFPTLEKRPRVDGFSFYTSGENQTRVFRALARREGSEVKLAVTALVEKGASSTFRFIGAEQDLYLLIERELSLLPRLANDPPLPSFIVGQIYDRREDLHEPFGGSRQSGISPSGVVPAIFIFTGGSGERYGYGDRFSDDGAVFYYSGEGQRGDMTFSRGNLALRDHSSTGKALHLFKILESRKGQEYLGEFVYRNFAIKESLDVDGNRRNAIIFELVPVALLEREELAPPIAEPISESLEEAQLRAIEASKTDGRIGSLESVRTIYQRSADVRNYVLRRANGICECCKMPAPFRRPDGSAYLEPHHTTKVSDGGPDHPKFVAALCPACHREVHYGEAASDKNSALQERLLLIEAAG